MTSINQAPPSPDDENRSSLNEIERIAHHFLQSGYFKDLRNVSQAVVKIIKGRALNIDEFTACDQINIIQGKPAPNANLIATLIRKSKIYDYEILEKSDTVCAIRMYRNGKPLEPVERFTFEDAQRAGLTRNQNYKSFPPNMLFARCISNAGRFHAPDITTGLYTPEDFPDANTSAPDTFPDTIVPENPDAISKLMTDTNTSLEDLNNSLGTSFKSPEELGSQPFVLSFLRSKKEARG